jgi:pimeloyl-ACP methyl ester carboxylesterase
MSYKPSLVSFKTTDNLILPALLYQPKEKTKKVAIWLHGNGSTSVFYSVNRMNTLGNIFADRGIAFFPFNNRGAHIIKSLKKITEQGKEEKIQVGMAYELIKDSVKDIDGAVDFLKEQGYEEFYLIGHSSGANKICVYNYYKKGQTVFSKYVLLAGGDDTGLYYKNLGKDMFYKLLKKSKEKINQGQGMEPVSEDLVPFFISYQSLYDTINPDGDYNTFPFLEIVEDIKLSGKKLFRYFNSIEKPTLVLYGGDDEFIQEVTGESNSMEDIMHRIEGIFVANSAKAEALQFKVLPEADHGFSEKERE